MGYSVSDSVVRVDRFRLSGKWYDTLAVDMERFYTHYGVKEALQEAMRAAGHNYLDWIVVCLEPYHQNSHPVSLIPNQKG